MGINRVTLDALPQVINYYRNKFGFRLSKTCHEDHSVEQVIAGMSPKPNFTSLPEVHADPEMVQLLNLIIDMGLSANPNCMAARAEGIRNNSIDYLQVCSSDGYLMTLCLDEVVPQRKRKQPTRRQGKRVRVS